MYVTDEKWQAMIDVVEASIARWNEKAVKYDSETTFKTEVHDTGDYAVLMTSENSKYGTMSQKAVAREKASGEIRKTSLKTTRRKGGIRTSFTIKTPDPKFWAKLADKSAAEIVDGLKLTDYFMVIGATHIGTESGAQKERA